jgi:hypothetical protein
MSRLMPTASDTTGPSEDSAGDPEARRAFEKTALETNPMALGSSQRNGSTEPR